MAQAPPIEELTASLHDNKKHLLLAASGSVATIKLPNIIQSLSSHGDLSIRVLLTPSAARFLEGQSQEQPSIASIATLPNVDGVYRDTDEWRQPWKRGNAILHIELRRWADILVIAPLSANTLAKIVGGMADGILTSVVRAWDARGELDSDVLALREGGGGSGGGDGSVGVPGEAEAPLGDGGGGQTTAADSSSIGNNRTTRRNRTTKKKRIVVAPAMNTAMWRHPITAKQIRVLEKEWGVVGNAKNSGSEDAAGSKSDSTAAATAAASSAAQHHHHHHHHDDYDGYDGKTEDDGGSRGEGEGEGEAEGWFEVLRPQTKLLACGDRGDGAMCEWTDIVRVIEDRLGLSSSD